MKYFNIALSINIIILFASCIIISSCSESENETQKDKTLRLLSSGTWHISQATFDNVDETDSFTGMYLTFSKGTYASSNGEPVWSASGLWSFTNDNAKAIVRDDDVEVTIQSISQTKLTITLQMDKTVLTGGRLHSVNGEYVFEFSR